jgi:predicted nucleic acid-binding protein
MKPRVYVETSVISYLTARESASLVGATRQLLTRRWWDRRSDYEIVISEVVVRECRVGDADAVNRRLAVIEGLPSLTVNARAADIAIALLKNNILPEKAAEDALHIAVASVHSVDFLLSWNFRHIANPTIQAKVAAYLTGQGLSLPFICPPEELLGDEDA